MLEKNFYCDMDGVIADFNNEVDALKRYAVEKGFFKNLKPIEKNLKVLKLLNKIGNLYIISISPNPKADKDKMKWLKKYAPFIKKDNIIILRTGLKKVDYMKSDNGILFDDYTNNIIEWLKVKNNRAFKITSEYPIERYIKDFI